MYESAEQFIEALQSGALKEKDALSLIETKSNEIARLFTSASQLNELVATNKLVGYELLYSEHETLYTLYRSVNDFFSLINCYVYAAELLKRAYKKHFNELIEGESTLDECLRRFTAEKNRDDVKLENKFPEGKVYVDEGYGNLSNVLPLYSEWFKGCIALIIYNTSTRNSALFHVVPDLGITTTSLSKFNAFMLEPGIKKALSISGCLSSAKLPIDVKKSLEGVGIHPVDVRVPENKKLLDVMEGRHKTLLWAVCFTPKDGTLYIESPSLLTIEERKDPFGMAATQAETQPLRDKTSMAAILAESISGGAFTIGAHAEEAQEVPKEGGSSLELAAYSL